MLKKLMQYAPVQIFSALSVFLLIAIQTKFLGVEDYGMLAIFFLIIEVVRSFSAQWVNTSLLRLYPAASKENQNHYRTIAVYLLSALFLPAAGLVAAAIFYYEVFTWSILIYLSLLLLSKSAYMLLLDMARLNDRASAYRTTSMLQSLLSILLTYVFLSYSSVLESALLALAVSYVVVLPFVVIRVRLTILYDAKSLAIPMFTYGLPLLVSGTLASLSSRVDRLFIADSIGLVETGVYSALSNMLLGVMALVFMVVAMPLYPEMTKAINNKAKLAVLHAKYFKMLMLVSLPALIGVCLIAEPMISLFLTAEYLQYGVELFYILALSVFILNVRGHYVDHGLQFTLNTHFLPFIVGVSIIINIALLSILLGEYGLYGAAVASLVTNIITLCISFVVAKRKGYQYHFSVDLIKIIFASAVMTVVMLFLRSVLAVHSNGFQLSILISCGALSYAGMHFLLNTANVRSYFDKVLSK